MCVSILLLDDDVSLCTSKAPLSDFVPPFVPTLYENVSGLDLFICAFITEESILKFIYEFATRQLFKSKSITPSFSQ